MEFFDERIANLILSLKKLKGIGNKTIINLLQERKADLIQETDYSSSFLINLRINAITKGLENTPSTWREIQKESANILEYAFEENILIVHPYMKEYPKRLLVNENFPPILFCKGDISKLNNKKIVSIVGTREPTDFGSKMTYRLSELLSSEGYVIVSGLAKGSDSIAHKGALNSLGNTIAVLPTPIDGPVYPPENEELAMQIIDTGGLLVSEYEPKSILKGRELISNLVARDEWQAGLSDGVVATETSIKGGTNHAINHAIKTKTPVAVFDYSARLKVDFFEDERFGGNVKYINEGNASPIYLPETIENFKQEMDLYHEGMEKKFKVYIQHQKRKENKIENMKLF